MLKLFNPAYRMHRTIILLICLQVSLAGNSQTNDITLLRDIYHNRNIQFDKPINILSESVKPIS
ncbi:MAG: hypothetical protein ACM3ME_03490, partial [Chloroflexota bacterium]